MITYVNNSNAEQYRVLYAKATKDLMSHNSEGNAINPGGDAAIGRESIIPIQGDAFGGTNPEYEPYTFYTWDAKTEQYELASEQTPSADVTYYSAPDITSLNEYFSYIEALARINPIYTVLPLDEDTFNIDANTRMIEVPSHFQKNGISVQGDEIAEVIYFKINRYFDTIDLATKDIYIQWRSAASNEEGQLIEGVSVPWCVDYESAPNYIIFGWPISSKITAAAGEISFAVRFYEFENDTNQITYSLSTLTQKVSVKPSLDFNILDKFLEGKGMAESTLVLDDNTNLILSRLENSELNDASVVAGEPYFIVNLNPANTEVVVDENNVSTTEAWLGLDADGFRTVTIYGNVEAAGDGRISYSWKKYNIDDNELMPIEFTNKFENTEDDHRVEGKSYYYNITNINDDSAYKVYTEDIFDPDDPDYPENGIFERFSSATIDSVGKYFVSVTNRVQNSTSKIGSYTLYVKRPVEPVIDTNLVESGWLKPNLEDETQNYKLTLTIVVSSSDQEKSKFTYQWQRMMPGTQTWVDIEGATEASYTIVGGEERIEGSEVGRVGDGNYRVLINNNLNKETIQISSASIRVTHGASAPKITIVGRTSFNLAEAAQNGLKVNAVIEQSEGEDRVLGEGKDGISYQWYKYKTGTGPDTTTEKDVEKANAGTYVYDDDILLEGETGDTYYPNAVGHYYCMAKNTYNGDEATKISRFFVVTDA